MLNTTRLFLRILALRYCSLISAGDFHSALLASSTQAFSGCSASGFAVQKSLSVFGFAPIFPDTCYHLTHYWPAAADIPVASDNPVHYADAIRYNARTPLQGSLLPLTRLV